MLVRGPGFEMRVTGLELRGVRFGIGFYGW